MSLRRFEETGAGGGEGEVIFLDLGRSEIEPEFLNIAFDFALETKSLEAEPAHGPVGFFGPRHERVEDGDRRIDVLDAVVVLFLATQVWSPKAKKKRGSGESFSL